MSCQAVIVDTNVVVAGLLTVHVASPGVADSGEQLLWELLAARADLLLITGDQLLLRDSGMQGRIVSPQSLMAGG